MKTIYLQSYKISAFSQSEIIGMIPPETLKKIKATNPHPYFQAYSICHEGVANPTILGEEAKPIHWLKKAIQSIKKTVLKGIKFFLGHNEDNSTDGRQDVGEVVADFQKEIDGQLHQVVIGYFPEKEIVKNMDICSQEADWNLLEFSDHYIADTLEKITGIALGSSEQDKPAFENAKRLAVVQAYQYNESSGKDVSLGKRKKTMTFNELRDGIRELNVFPSQVFNLEDLKRDREFNSIFAENKELKDQLDSKKDYEDLKEKINQMEAEKNDLSHKVQLSTAKVRLEKILNDSEQKFTDKQKQYIAASFSEDTQDVSDEGLLRFAQNQLKNFQAAAKIFNVSEDQSSSEQTGSSNQEVDDKADFTKASNNEFLGEDAEVQLD